MRVLIVEDEPISAKVVASIVAPYGEYVHVDDGGEAFKLFCAAHTEGRAFDVILLDIMMPNIDGQEALYGIRAFESAHGIAQEHGVKVIMTTALSDSESRHHAQAGGCCDYLLKPIDKRKLLQSLSKMGLIVET
ncbi:response regulator [Oligoflexia bacterium]|nr:response regulator [Oligoflexia bacterium]